MFLDQKLLFRSKITFSIKNNFFDQKLLFNKLSVKMKRT